MDALDKENTQSTGVWETGNYDDPAESSGSPAAGVGAYESLTPTEQIPAGQATQPKDVAETAGSAYSGIAAGAEGQKINVGDYDPTKTRDMLGATTQIKDASSYVDEARGTVAGQLERLLDKENKYMKQAESRGRVAASRLGQLGSSMGVGAMEGQRIAAALPIAKADAESYNRFALGQQQAEMTTAQHEKEAVLSSQIEKYTADIDRSNKNIDQKFAAAFAGADATTQAALTSLQESYKTDLAKLQGTIQENLIDKELGAATKRMAFEQASSVLQNYQVTVENMLTNPSFLELGEAAIANGINQLQNLATNQVQFLGAAAGTDFTELVDFYFSDVITAGDLG